MDFGLSEPQVLLRRSVRELLERELPVERVRETAEADDFAQAARGVTARLAEQGATGLLVPAERGGVGLQLLDACVVAQELGRALTPINFHASQVLAPLLLSELGNEAVQERWLSGIADGTTVVAVVLGPGAEPLPAESRRLGAAEVPCVADASIAELFLIPTRHGCWLVESGDPGIRIDRARTVDQTRETGEVVLAERATAPDLPDPDGCGLRRALAAARIALVADALGASYRAIEIAVAYALEREQFGRIIGSYQAVKHMCAEMIANVDPVQSLLWWAAHEWDRGPVSDVEALEGLGALVLAHAAEVGTGVATVATQVFGGMGFTWECDMHLYYKRLEYDRQMLGGPDALRALAAETRLGGEEKIA